MLVKYCVYHNTNIFSFLLSLCVLSLFETVIICPEVERHIKAQLSIHERTHNVFLSVFL